MEKQGYSVEQVEELKLYYHNKITEIRLKEKEVSREVQIAKRILDEISNKEKKKTKEVEKTERRSKQPIL